MEGVTSEEVQPSSKTQLPCRGRVKKLFSCVDNIYGWALLNIKKAFETAEKHFEGVEENPFASHPFFLIHKQGIHFL